MTKRNLIKSLLAALAAGGLAMGDAHALESGDSVPGIAVPSTSGETVNLRDVPGWKVVYFYPKSFTPGCTKQACGLRDADTRYRELGVTVFGVSVDDLETQKKFKEKYALPFELLADADKELAKAFDALSFVGFAKRMTFVVDPDGKVTDVIDSVSVGTHDADVADLIEKRIRGE